MAFDAGIRYFDTALLYGHGRAERRFAQVLPDLPRADLTVSTKVGRLLRPDATLAGTTQGIFHDVPPFAIEHDYSADGAIQLPGIHNILLGNEAGGMQAARLFLSKGHVRTAFVAGPAESAVSDARLSGFRLGLAESGALEPLILPGDYLVSGGAGGRHADRRIGHAGCGSVHE